METMQTKQPVIIGLIHANWCGHCRNMMPAWNQMQHNINRKPYHPPPQYMMIEHSKMGELDRFNAENAAYLQNGPIESKGFPTIFKIENGKIEYYGERESPDDHNEYKRDPQSMEKWFMQNHRVATPHPRGITRRTYSIIMQPQSTTTKSRRHKRRHRSLASRRNRKSRRQKLASKLAMSAPTSMR